MIGYLEGKLKHKSPDFIIVDVHGVGYFVNVPLSTFYDLPELGQTVTLNIHTHLREDALQLFGFNTMAEKEMFLHLVTVNGVGPRLAIGILSGMNPDALRQAVQGQDHQRLRNIPGVGKKIAERIVLELRDRLKIRRVEKTEELWPLCPIPGTYADAFSALVNLGYRPAEAEKAIRTAQQHMGDTEDPPLEALLKESLRLLAQ
jgi:holliday junction DNA helicase RuvA